MRIAETLGCCFCRRGADGAVEVKNSCLAKHASTGNRRLTRLLRFAKRHLQRQPTIALPRAPGASRMNEDLRNEVEAINSIYGEGSLVNVNEDNIFILHLPQQETSLRLQFPCNYPAAPPSVLGSQSSGEHTRKGEAAHVVEAFRAALGRLYLPGEVCLFDVIEEVNVLLSSTVTDEGCSQSQPKFGSDSASEAAQTLKPTIQRHRKPPWILSEIVIELKSVFIARTAQVSSTEQAKEYLQHLLDSDKKVRSATHNITAWRIKGKNDVTYQDCDDDGETAAGGRVLHLMQLMDLWNVMVVVTRWYGGHQLGPKRFSIINAVARDAFVKGGFVKDDATSAAKKKSKR